MAIFGQTGGYGYNPLDPGEQLKTMPADLNYQAALDDSGYGRVNGAISTSNAWNPLNIAGGLPGATTNFNPGNAQAQQPAQIPAVATPSNDQYINTGTSWIRNPDFNPLAELRGGALQAYQMDNSIAKKMGYQENGVGNAGYDPALLRQTRRQLDLAGGMDNFFGSSADSTQEQLNLQNALRGAVQDPFAGQNMNDASVQFQMKQYMEKNPGYIPINTYRGEAPRTAGQINQDTGQMTTEQGSFNPYAGNKGFVQQLPWQGQQQQQAPYQAPQQQQNPYLQPFQQTSAYQSAVGQNWASPAQPQQQNVQQQGQPSFGNPQNNFGSGQSQGFGNLQNKFQSMYQNQQPQQQQGFGQGSFGGNRFGLKSAYGSR